MRIDRRAMLAGAGALGAGGVFAPFVRPSHAQAGTLKIGLLLPYSGTYAALGEAITNGMTLYLRQQGDRLAGRGVTIVKVDDESAPPKATELTTKLVSGEKVDALIGTVHSGVAMAMVKIAREDGLPTIVPNAGADALSRAPVRAERVPLVLRQRAGRRGDGQGDARRRPQEGRHRDVEICGRRRKRERLQEGLHGRRRRGAEGHRPALPRRRIPVDPRRDRHAEARRRLCLLRGRRRAEIPEGLCRRRIAGKDRALGAGLPHRRRRDGGWSGRRRREDRAALCRHARQSAEQGVRDRLSGRCSG